MGNGIAQVFATYGYELSLADISQANLDAALKTIENSLSRMVAKGSLTEATASGALKKIKTHTDISDALKHADLAIEAATENLNVKAGIFREMDAHTPKNCILATNTSSISITRLAAATKRPELVVGMHFMNPVPLMKLVEVISGYHTAPATVQSVTRMAESLDKIPVSVRDYPGFVANRILMPMINEAIESLHHGVAGVEAIDSVMKLGMGHPMGPLQLADFIGLDVCLSILQVLHEGFGNPKYAPSPLLVNMVQAGSLGVKAGAGFYEYSESRKAEKVSSRFRS